jgi:hypothetical protein
MSLNFAQYVRLDIPEGRVKQITDGAGNVIWKAGYVNMVRISTTNNGTTIYNGTGYKNGYRIRSGGAEGAQTTSACTGFIPVNGGDIIRISGCDFSTAGGTSNAINVADASFSNIGQMTPSYADAGYGIFAPSAAYQSYCYKKAVTQEKTGVWKWTVPPAAAGIAYIRVSGYNVSGNHGANMIVTVNEEIT